MAVKYRVFKNNCTLVFGYFAASKRSKKVGLYIFQQPSFAIDPSIFNVEYKHWYFWILHNLDCWKMYTSTFLGIMETVRCLFYFLMKMLFNVPLIFMILKLSHNLYYKVNNMKKTIQSTMKSVVKINIEIRMKASRRFI